MPENLNSKDILKLLSDLNTSLTKDCYIPSANTHVKLKPLTTTHLKNIIKSTMDGPFAQVQFNINFHPILKEVLDADLGNVNIYDKVAIALQLRNINVSKTLPVTLKAVTPKEPVDKEYPDTIVHSLDIAEHIKFIEATRTDELFKADTIKEEGYLAGIYFPSLNEEFLFDSHLFSKHLSKVKEDDTKAFRDLFGPMFMNNVSQYIKSVKIGDSLINLVKMPVVDRIAVVNDLPQVQNIFKSIDSNFGKAIQKITRVSIVQDEIEYSGDIEIGPELFVSN